MINPITILVNYLFLFIVSKINKYELYINNEYYNYMFEDTRTCAVEYKEDFQDYDDYKQCVSEALFENADSLSKFPESQNKYLQKFIDELGNIEDDPTFDKNFKPIYFEFMLEMLKISAADENYNSIYTDIMHSTNVDKAKIYSDIKSGKIDMKKITDDRYNKVAEKLYYKNFFNDISKTYDEKNFNANDFFKSDVKNEDIFLSVVNEEFFSNQGTNDEIRFYINYHDSYNIKSRELDRDNINKRGIENAGIFNKTEIDKFNRFLVDYQSRNIETIIEKMAKNEKSQYNIFDMIFNLSTFLKNDLKIMYLYEKDENNKLNITSKIDPNSIYEDSESFSESIYNLIYDYYSVIYNIYQNEKIYNQREIIYYYDNDKIVYDLINVAALNTLMESKFYQSIYSTMIFLEKQNGVKNRYISESIELVNELFNFYTSNHELGKIKKIEKEEIKEEIDDQNEINYEKDINDSYDVLFKENTFIDLIDYESDYTVYFSQLQEYIQNSCEKYNRIKFYSKGISAIELQDYYNTRVLDSDYVLRAASETCLDKDKMIYSDWNESISKSVDAYISNVETMRNAQLLAMDIFIKKMIDDNITSRIDNESKNNSLIKRNDSHQGKKYESKFNDPNNKKNHIILLNKEINKDLKNIFKRQDKTKISTYRKKLTSEIEYEYEIKLKNNNIEVKRDLSTLAPDGEKFISVYDLVQKIGLRALKFYDKFSGLGKVIEIYSPIITEELVNEYKEHITKRSLTRELNIIEWKEIGKRTGEDFKRFQLQHCRNDEIKFFSLARNYNRIMGDKEPYLKENIPGFGNEINIKVFSVPISMKDDNVGKELTDTKEKFKSDMKEIFNNYMNMTYKNYRNMTYGYTPENMMEKIHTFNIKLELVSEREAFYSRDLSSIVEKMKTFSTRSEMKNEYPPDELSKIVDYLLDVPYSIEKGYSQLVTHVDKNFFHEYDENNKQGNEKYIDNNNNNNSPIENEYDELNSKQKTVISDVIYESLINLNSIKYSNEKTYNAQPVQWEEDREESLETVKNIESYYSDQLIIKREYVKEMVRPKKFFSFNREISDPNDEEDIFYMDNDNKIIKANTTILQYFKDKSIKEIQKTEYILPDEPEEVYIASNKEYKSSSSSLPPNQKFIAKDETGEYTFIETDKTGKITNGQGIKNKKLYLCKQINVEYSEILIPEKIKENEQIPEKKKSDIYSYKNGFVQSRADEGYMEYRFKGDNTKYEGYASFITKKNEHDHTPKDPYNKAQKSIKKRNRIKNIYRKPAKYLNKVQEKVKNVIGKGGKGGKGKKPGKGH